MIPSCHLNCRYLAVIVFLLTTPALSDVVWADIYQQTDADGVTCFTDTPTTAGYSLILRERQFEKKTMGSTRTLPKHLSAIESAARPIETPVSRNSGNYGNSRYLPVQGRVTSLAGLRNDPFDGKLRHHNGMDIACPSGTPVKPVAAGTVIFSGSRPGYGNVVVVEHPDGTVTLYAHNARNLSDAGDLVDSTSVIALTGSTGRSTGPHLHFEAWHNGENITHSYLPGGSPATPLRTLAEVPIKRYLQADGTLVFTNLP